MLTLLPSPVGITGLPTLETRGDRKSLGRMGTRGISSSAVSAASCSLATAPDVVALYEQRVGQSLEATLRKIVDQAGSTSGAAAIALRVDGEGAAVVDAVSPSSTVVAANAATSAIQLGGLGGVEDMVRSGEEWVTTAASSALVDLHLDGSVNLEEVSSRLSYGIRSLNLSHLLEYSSEGFGYLPSQFKLVVPTNGDIFYARDSAVSFFTTPISQFLSSIELTPGHPLQSAFFYGALFILLFGLVNQPKE